MPGFRLIKTDKGPYHYEQCKNSVYLINNQKNIYP